MLTDPDLALKHCAMRRSACRNELVTWKPHLMGLQPLLESRFVILGQSGGYPVGSNSVKSGTEALFDKLVSRSDTTIKLLWPQQPLKCQL